PSRASLRPQQVKETKANVPDYFHCHRGNRPTGQGAHTSAEGGHSGMKPNPMEFTVGSWEASLKHMFAVTENA
ncbi:hypothetical protein MTO96_027763, partial [Rhipicephalus appendiculatus]